MFLLMGISQKNKEFDFTQSMVCSVCGRSGQYIVYMTYTVLSLFFIPCLKWGKRYFVRTSCCNTVYSLDPQVGKCIARGMSVEIRPEDLQMVSAGWVNEAPSAGAAQASSAQTSSAQASSAQAGGVVDPWTNTPAQPKFCSQCGYEAAPDFDYCPKCGNKL